MPGRYEQRIIPTDEVRVYPPNKNWKFHNILESYVSCRLLSSESIGKRVRQHTLLNPGMQPAPSSWKLPRPCTETSG